MAPASSRTTGDFGVTGELPSQPELLDWLAVEFREDGLGREAVLQADGHVGGVPPGGAATPEKLEKDPPNRLLSRGPRFRMDAEMIRDYALAASGLLVGKIGGPSVKPYQPDGRLGGGGHDRQQHARLRRDSGEKLYRRSMYTFWKRAAPPASMDIFNAPSREVCTVRRERTEHAAASAGDAERPAVRRGGRRLAEKTLKQAATKRTTGIDSWPGGCCAGRCGPRRRRWCRRRLRTCWPTTRRTPTTRKKLLAVGESKADATLDAATLAAWTMLANELMNLDEVLNK